MLLTAHDCVDHVLDFCQVDPSAEADRFARRALALAMNQFPQMRRWNYAYSPFLLTTNASQNTGTIVFDYTGGANELQVTLTGATWPSWASLGVLRIGTVDYEIASRVSSTIITLSENSNPGEDVASTTYTLYRNQYPMPNDFMAMGSIINQSNLQALKYISPSEWHERVSVPYGPALPVTYTIMGSRNYLNTLSLYMWPAPNTAQTYQGLYQRTMRPIKIVDYNSGSVTVAADSTTVTGTGTAWTSRMAGSVIRFGTSTTDSPTGIGGAYPFETERMVVSVASGTSLAIDAVTGTAYTGVKHRISDPIDLRENNMLTLFLRECEKQVCRVRRMKMDRLPEEREEYALAQVMAYETDEVNFEPRHATVGAQWYDYALPLRYYPADLDG